MLPRLTALAQRGGQALFKFQPGRCLSTTVAMRSGGTPYQKPDWYDDSGASMFIPQPPPVEIADHREAYVYEDEAPKSLLDTFRDIAGTSATTTIGLTLPIFLLSKELWIIHEESFYVLGLSITLGLLIKFTGPMYQAYADKERATCLAELECERNERRTTIDDELKQLDSNAELLSTTDELFSVFKDTRTMEAETKYRKNLLEVETEVKKRLDYQVDLQNLKRKLEQQHMAQWLENAVVSSITAEQEQQTMLKCIEDIDVLADAHAATA